MMTTNPSAISQVSNASTLAPRAAAFPRAEATPADAGAPLPGDAFHFTPTAAVAFGKITGPLSLPAPTLRPIFREAERLGLLTAGASIGGPVGTALSQAAKEDLLQLLREFDLAGLDFRAVESTEEARPHWKLSAERLVEKILVSNGDWASGHRSSPSFTSFEGEEIVVSGQGMQMARVTSFHDLQVLEAMAVQGHLTSVPRPDLASTLVRLEKAGVEFQLTPGEQPSRLVGAYGAYRALTVTPTMAPDEALMLGASVDGQQARPIRSADDLESLRFFVLGEDVPGLARSAQAQTLRRLEQEGYTFHPSHDPEQRLGAAAVFEELGQSQGCALEMGVRGAARERLEPEQLAGRRVGSDALRDLSAYWMGDVGPRVRDGRLDRRGGDRWMQAVARPIGSLKATERGRMMDSLRHLEATLSSNGDCVETAARALDALADGYRPGETPDEATRAYEKLRRVIPVADVAIAAVRHVRVDLPPRAFDSQDLEEQSQQVVRLARLAPSFEEAKQALELVETTVVFEEGARLLEQLTEMHRGLRSSEKDEAWSSRSPFGRAMEDYKMVLRHRVPGETLDDACTTLKTMYEPLLPREGWKPAQDAFGFVQRGWGRKAFPFASKKEAVDAFLGTWLLAGRLEAARQALLRPPEAGAGSVQTAEDQVTVGGVRIPRRLPARG